MNAKTKWADKSMTRYNDTRVFRTIKPEHSHFNSVLVCKTIAEAFEKFPSHAVCRLVIYKIDDQQTVSYIISLTRDSLYFSGRLVKQSIHSFIKKHWHVGQRLVIEMMDLYL